MNDCTTEKCNEPTDDWYGIPQRVWVGIAPPPVRQPNGLLRHLDDIIRRAIPKPISDTFKAAPKPPEVFTVPAWRKYQDESAIQERISLAVLRETQNQLRFGRDYL